MDCAQCGRRIDESSGECVPCGARVDGASSERLGDIAAVRMLLPVGRSGFAIAAGYVGLFALVLPVGLISVLLGILAILDMRKHPQKHGMGRAIFGIVMGVLNTALFGAILVSVLTG